ncbi:MULTISPECIES: mandelate racemase/muconate lactonizing enzyme family protein [Paracoccaceae]|jgi:L-alanine-DL-glutamate epimerase-like enolase superfamily enzyme|uniref:mandelate racemase/muconate lactonizing enzyme family protein n=1 Tax=Paracoccaceae TaxID=31989 RepID=UPI003028DCB6
MKITRIALHAFELPLAKPHFLSRGRRFDRFGSSVIRIDTDEGLSGWAEVCPWGSSYLAAFPGGVRAAVTDIAPALIGENPLKPEQIYRTMDQELAGHSYAKALIDFAIWDIVGKWAGRPLHDMLGGSEEPAPLLSASLHLDTPQGMVAARDKLRAEGVSTFSVKMGQGIATDCKVIEAFESTRLPEERNVYDANGGWSPLEAITIMNRVPQGDITFEQPCATYEQCLGVRGKTRQAISLDECLGDLQTVLRAISDQACEAVNIKLARVGGYTKARIIRDVLLSCDLSMYVMCMAGTALSDTISAQFAKTVPENRLIGTWSCQDLVTLDICPGQGARPSNGRVAPPDLPGLGVVPDEALIGAPVAVFG